MKTIRDPGNESHWNPGHRGELTFFQAPGSRGRIMANHGPCRAARFLDGGMWDAGGAMLDGEPLRSGG